MGFTCQPNPTCCSFNETYTKHLDQYHFVQDVQNKHHHCRGDCFLECFLQRQCRITCVVVPSCNLSPNFYPCMLSFFLAGKTREICRETQFQQKGKFCPNQCQWQHFESYNQKTTALFLLAFLQGGKYTQGDFVTGPPLNMPVNN